MTISIRSKRSKSLEKEFKDTRSFLRQCMAAVVTGGLTHVQAQDIASLSQQQNYSIAIENAIMPLNGNPVAPKSLLSSAKELAYVDEENENTD